MGIQINHTENETIFREEDGTITSISPTLKSDLIIRQTRPGHSMVEMVSPRDEGLIPFSILLKFLIVSKHRIPPISVVGRIAPRSVTAQARTIGRQISVNHFPMHFPLTKDQPRWRAVVETANEKPFIAFHTEKGSMTFSTELSDRLVSFIPPTAYSGTRSFRGIVREMIGLIRNGKFNWNIRTPLPHIRTRQQRRKRVSVSRTPRRRLTPARR